MTQNTPLTPPAPLPDEMQCAMDKAALQQDKDATREGAKKKSLQITVHVPRTHVIDKSQSGFTLRREYKKTHRNQACPCGCGKKAKHCEKRLDLH